MKRKLALSLLCCIIINCLPLLGCAQNSFVGVYAQSNYNNATIYEIKEDKTFKVYSITKTYGKYSTHSENAGCWEKISNTQFVLFNDEGTQFVGIVLIDTLFYFATDFYSTKDSVISKLDAAEKKIIDNDYSTVANLKSNNKELEKIEISAEQYIENLKNA